jgi:hypothetical protein
LIGYFSADNSGCCHQENLGVTQNLSRKIVKGARANKAQKTAVGIKKKFRKINVNKAIDIAHKILLMGALGIERGSVTINKENNSKDPLIK